MKNIFITIFALSCFCMAFDAGTKNVSGGASYSSMTVGDADAISSMSVTPSIGYFVMDNLSAGFGLSMTQVGDADAMTTYDFGATYYMGALYGGGMYNGSTAEGADGALTFRAGYLHGLSDAFYLDCYGSYNMGLGDVSSSTMMFGVGFKSFF